MLQELVRLGGRARAMSQPPAEAALDQPYLAVWNAISHLFPAHAMVDRVDYGWLLVSWRLPCGRGAATHFAAPLMIRIEPGLLLALWTCEPHERNEIAREQEDTVRACLDEYDPHSRVPTCGVVVLGE
jgi:hypothetical protein